MEIGPEQTNTFPNGDMGEHMSDVTRVSDQASEWNVLTGRWMETMANEGGARDCSPLEALTEANTFRCIAAANALDLFAAHRFLLTLLYWKADAGGGVDRVRASLLQGNQIQGPTEATRVVESRR